MSSDLAFNAAVDLGKLINDSSAPVSAVALADAIEPYLTAARETASEPAPPITTELRLFTVILEAGSLARPHLNGPERRLWAQAEAIALIAELDEEVTP